jgi:hypothetical protein
LPETRHLLLPPNQALQPILRSCHHVCMRMERAFTVPGPLNFHQAVTRRVLERHQIKSQ